MIASNLFCILTCVGAVFADRTLLTWKEASAGRKSRHTDYAHKWGRALRAYPVLNTTAPSGASPSVWYTSNWSGAVKVADPGQIITSAAATFTIPTATVPPSQPTGGAWYGASWVGLGGATAGDGYIWQAGVYWYTASNGTAIPRAFYEWYFNGMTDVTGFPVAAGDVISIKINADRPSTGAAVFADLTNGRTTTVTTSAPYTSATLKGNSAAWITEDPEGQYGEAPFAKYSKVQFKNCIYGDYAGKTGLLNSGAHLVNLINRNSGQLSSQASAVGTSEVDTTWISS